MKCAFRTQAISRVIRPRRTEAWYNRKVLPDMDMRLHQRSAQPCKGTSGFIMESAQAPLINTSSRLSPAALANNKHVNALPSISLNWGGATGSEGRRENEGGKERGSKGGRIRNTESIIYSETLTALRLLHIHTLLYEWLLKVVIKLFKSGQRSKTLMCTLKHLPVHHSALNVFSVAEAPASGRTLMKCIYILYAIGKDLHNLLFYVFDVF